MNLCGCWNEVEIIKTYQDLIEVLGNERKTIDFCLAAIMEHKNSEDYQTAALAEEYDRNQNPTIKRYKHFLVNMHGNKVEDVWAPNYKIISGFFNRFVTQENQYLLGNGVILQKPENKKKLGFDFDMRLVDMGRNAIVQKVSFGFFDDGHLRVFKFTEFVPLFDEENGALRAGIRFWQIDDTKPLRFTLYEEDGFTEYLRRKDAETEVLREKRAYIQIVKRSEADGEEIYNYSNYPGFPIIPMYANEHKQSEIVGRQEAIDCYDLIKSGFANTVDEASRIYWILKNAGGMDDDVTFAMFLERMRMTGGANVNSEDGEDATPHTIDLPFEGREKLLERLEKDLYSDFMAFNVQQITSGNATATEINAAYQPFDNKVDKFEACVLDFLGKLFEIVGIEDEPKFNRSKITNQLETTQMVLMAAQYLDDETLLSKLPWLTQEEITKILERKAAENIERFSDFEVKEGEEDAEIPE